MSPCPSSGNAVTGYVTGYVTINPFHLYRLGFPFSRLACNSRNAFLCRGEPPRGEGQATLRSNHQCGHCLGDNATVNPFPAPAISEIAKWGQCADRPRAAGDIRQTTGGLGEEPQRETTYGGKTGNGG